MPTPESRAICSSVTGSRPDADAARAASSRRARFRSGSAPGRRGWVSRGLGVYMMRRVLRLSVTMDLPEVPPVPFHYATFGGSPMTTTGQSTDFDPAPSPSAPVPAPGGTARLAGRAVARIGFGAMQLERQHTDRDAALGVLRQAV